VRREPRGGGVEEGSCVGSSRRWDGKGTSEGGEARVAGPLRRIELNRGGGGARRVGPVAPPCPPREHRGCAIAYDRRGSAQLHLRGGRPCRRGAAGLRRCVVTGNGPAPPRRRGKGARHRLRPWACSAHPAARLWPRGWARHLSSPSRSQGGCTTARRLRRSTSRRVAARRGGGCEHRLV
jgi:hypothetical protein